MLEQVSSIQKESKNNHNPVTLKRYLITTVKKNNMKGKTIWEYLYAPETQEDFLKKHTKAQK